VYIETPEDTRYFKHEVFVLHIQHMDSLVCLECSDIANLAIGSGISCSHLIVDFALLIAVLFSLCMQYIQIVFRLTFHIYRQTFLLFCR